RAVRAREGFLRREASAGLGGRQHRHDCPVAHRHRVVFQHHAVRFDRHHVAGFDQQVDGFGGLLGHRLLPVGGTGHFTRLTYSPERVSTLITSSWPTNSGTRTTAPVSRVAGLPPPPEVSPRTPGSVWVICS